MCYTYIMASELSDAVSANSPKRQTNANVKQRSSETLFGTPIQDVAGAVLLWKKLFLYESVQQNRYLALNAPCWSTHEYLALVKFLLLHSDAKKWTAIKDVHFWTNAGEFVKDYLKTSHQRSGS